MQNLLKRIPPMMRMKLFDLAYREGYRLSTDVKEMEAADPDSQALAEMKDWLKAVNELRDLCKEE